MKILMVCLGNICRSPIAQGVLEKMVQEHGLDWEIDSAGTNGFHNGEHPHPHSVSVCAKHGIDISKQISRKITREDLDKYDHIFCMAQEVVVEMEGMFGSAIHQKPIRLLMDVVNPGKGEDVPDPWYGPASGYQPVYDQIHRGCMAFIQEQKIKPTP
jgi:protein-tyrosine phosphatase